MEEKSVEIPKIQGPLREQDSIRALLELLEQQGMEQEKGDVIRMADHIDTMEIQLGTVLKELGEVKKQLGVMQESKVKLFAVNTIQKAEHQVQTLHFQVGEWKRKFVERAEQAVFDFKEKGKDALASAVKGMHLTQGLQKLQSSLHTVMLSMDQKIDRLGSMAEELHAAKGHLKNAFLEMNGKDTAKITERNPEQGIIFQTQKVLFQSMRSIHKLEQKTERLQQQIGKLEERQGKQASLKDTLQELRQETAPVSLEKKKNRRQRSGKGEVKAMKEETTITFLASECGEFHGMGECIECTSLKEAFRHYQRFCKRSPQMVPSLEFSLHHADDPLYNEGEYPLATGEKGKELLSYVPYYANHPLVQEAVRELEKLEEQQKRQKKQSRER